MTQTKLHLSLEGELSHGESTLLLLLTESLLGGLQSSGKGITHLFLRQGTAHRASGLGTEVRGEVLGVGVVLLQLGVIEWNRTNSSSLLLAKHSQRASNVLAHHFDLGELGRSSTGHLSHTELRHHEYNNRAIT